MALIPETERVLGPVDILVNNAMNPIFSRSSSTRSRISTRWRR